MERARAQGATLPDRGKATIGRAACVLDEEAEGRLAGAQIRIGMITAV